MKTSNGIRIIEYVSEKIEKIEEQEPILQLLIQKKNNYFQLSKDINDRFGNRFERIRKINVKLPTEQEINLLVQNLFDTSVSTGLKRVFGMTERQMDEYNDVLDKIEVLINTFENRIKEVNNIIQSYYEDISNYFAKYEKSYLAMIIKVGVDKLEYNPVGEQEGKNTLAGNIYLGNLLQDIFENDFVAKMAENIMENACQNGNIRIPTYVDIKQTLRLLMYTEVTGLEKTMMDEVRAIMCQMINSMPVYNYRFIYLEEHESGNNLKNLLRLVNCKDIKPEGIHPLFCSNGYQMLETAFNSNDIKDKLQQLEIYIEKVTQILAGVESVAIYNLTAIEKIPSSVLIMDKLDSCLDDTTLNKINKITKNAERCGISIIALTSKKDDIYNMMNSTSCIKVEHFSQGDMYNGDGICSPFMLNSNVNIENSYVESIVQYFSNAKVVDNIFEHLFDILSEFGKKEAWKEIEIPYAVDLRGKIKEIRLGGTEGAHALISGSTGCGKSTLLHMIINSVILYYNPKDVELWLSDYKQIEFAVYMKNTPPHIKFVGIERTEEFSFTFIDHIFQEYERRLELFRIAEVANIRAYKEKKGLLSISRIIVIIDEFHVMAQQIQGNEYSQKLENILSEGRAVGITCIFSDQAICSGLRGLTDKSRNQLRIRMAMRNSSEEIKETLQMQGSVSDLSEMQTGEITTRCEREIINEKGEKETKGYYEKYKVIFLQDLDRENLCKKANDTYVRDIPPILVDGKNRERMDLDIIHEYEMIHPIEENRISIYLGTPSNLDSCFCIRPSKNFGNNLMSIGENNELQKSILINTIKSFQRQSNYKIYILADENDDLYIRSKDALKEMKEQDSFLILADNIVDVCKYILELQNVMYIRRKESDSQNILVLWLGLDNMAQEFSYYESYTSNKENNHFSIEDSLELKFAQVFGEEPKRLNKPINSVPDVFDASENIQELIKEGAKRGIYLFIFLSSVLPLKMIRYCKLEHFKFKIGFSMDSDSSLEYFGKSRLMDDVSDPQAVFYDGGKNTRRFLPYVID